MAPQDECALCKIDIPSSGGLPFEVKIAGYKKTVCYDCFKKLEGMKNGPSR